jgi:hypothetical protein
MNRADDFLVSHVEHGTRAVLRPALVTLTMTATTAELS